ncbi:Protein cwh43 [Leucoagaricus sp. SymC.cos]|nr:Protein cwh43 [Leucoagaricus sp. SymC.cos]
MSDGFLQPATLRAATIARTHTILAYSAFASAFGIGCLLHYKKIVKNGVAGYPQEWFPSVSATIGDWYPERNLFQILIALTSGPRLALVYLQYHLQARRSKGSSWPTFLFITGVIRTLSCGGWVYITSSDDHDAHDVFMILYMVCNLPWMAGGVLLSQGRSVRRRRTGVASASVATSSSPIFLCLPLFSFFVSIAPLVYFFVQHKVHRIPGAYTQYAFFEWGLIFFDVLYDSISEREFAEADLKPSVSSVGSNDRTPATVLLDGMSQGKLSLWSLLTALAPRPFVSFLSDVYLSYIFLTLFTALIPTLFYFSIWELGIAGQELALLAVLSPFFFGFASIYDFSRSQTGQVTLRGLSFIGLAAYLLNKPLHRLVAVTPAVALGTLAEAAKWTQYDSGYQSMVFGLGWIATSLVKHANHTNNPLWPFINDKSGGYNKTGLVLAVLALSELFTRTSPPVVKSIRPHVKSTHWLSPALALGTLIFSIHNLLADSSTLITWSWSGYENGVSRGPLPHVHGALTLIVHPVTDVNIIRSLISHPGFCAFGATSTYVLYEFENWFGYIGGLGVALFMMCIIPYVFEQVSAARLYAGRMLGTAFVVYCLLNLASIFTVAYAFVPGGVYFRERTDLVLFTQIALLFPLFSSLSNPVGRSSESSAYIPRTKASYVYFLLSLMSVTSGLVTLYRLPSSPPYPFKPGPRVVQAGIWTVHFGFDNEGHDSQRGIRNLIRDMQLDIVGLLETDLHRTSFGHRDLTRVAVEDLGYNVDIGPGPDRHTWGCVLLSKYPIINSTHHLLPSPHGELAPAIEAVLDVHGTEVTIVVAHNGQEEDPLDRELQSTELARIMAASYPKPVIFLGYVVTKPHAKRPNPYEIMVADGRVHDIDQDDLDRWCEYIFYRGLYRTAYARISRGIITDTEMQIGQFVLPHHGTSVSDESIPARYSRARKEQLPVEHWFPMEYYGGPSHGGVDGHYYHVFDTVGINLFNPSYPSF